MIGPETTSLPIDGGYVDVDAITPPNELTTESPITSPATTETDQMTPVEEIVRYEDQVRAAAGNIGGLSALDIARATHALRMW